MLLPWRHRVQPRQRHGRTDEKPVLAEGPGRHAMDAIVKALIASGLPGQRRPQRVLEDATQARHVTCAHRKVNTGSPWILAQARPE